MYDYYLVLLPRASKWNPPIFDHSEVKIDLYVVLLYFFMQTNDLTVGPIRRNGKEFVNNSLQT